MNILRTGLRIAATVALASTLGACVVWDATPADSPYYEAYGYPDYYRGPGYYGPGYYEPGYYGGYWWAGGYYTPPYGGYYAPYPYYPGTHVIIDDRDRRPPPRDRYDDDGRKSRRPNDPVGPQPQGGGDGPRSGYQGSEPQHPFGIPDRAYHDDRGEQGPAPGYGGGTPPPPPPQVREQPNRDNPYSEGQRPPRPIPPGQVPANIYRQGTPPPAQPAPPPNIYRQVPPPRAPSGSRDGDGRGPGGRDDGDRR